MKDRIDLEGYKERLTTPLRQATLCFLIKDGHVLLAMKKRGLGQGKYNGVGGKMDDKDTSIQEAAKRETQEEIGVTPENLTEVAVLNFYHLGPLPGGQQVTVYLSDKWNGEPTESDEMAPCWFGTDELPYGEMWEDDKLWIPLVLQGKRIEADFLFDENDRLVEQNIRELKPLQRSIK